MNRARLFALGPLVLSVLVPDCARAACVDGKVWSGPIPMPVVINQTIDDDLCPNSGCGSFDEIRFTTQATLDHRWQHTGSRFQMKYDGSTAEARATVIPNKVPLFANPCTGGTLGIAAWDSNRTWGKIRMCSSNDGGVINWRTDASDSSGPTYAFSNVLGAELAHIVGMKHVEDCPTVERSISVASIRRDGSHLFPGDFTFLQRQFGYRTTQWQSRTTSDGITHVAGGAAPSDLKFAFGRLAASNNLSGAKSFVAWGHQQYRTLYLGKYDGGG
ncbi:MAG: hypothetical protein EXR72_13365 [Myxococcales bacterium]|nr:hypothetical protein [Myxococcales bacterium]